MLKKLLPERMAAKFGLSRKRKERIRGLRGEGRESEKERSGSRRERTYPGANSSRRQHSTKKMRSNKRLQSPMTPSNKSVLSMSKETSERRRVISPSAGNAENSAISVTGSSRVHSSSTLKTKRRQRDFSNKSSRSKHQSSRSRRNVAKSNRVQSVEDSTRTAKVCTPGWHQRWRSANENRSSWSIKRSKELSDSERSTTSSRRRKRDRIKAFFFSRPMNETSVNKVVAKIKHREQLRKDAARDESAVSQTSSFSNQLRSPDDAFPSLRRKTDSKLSPIKSSPSRGSKERSLSGERPKTAQELIQASKQSLVRENYRKVKNKDNDGHLLDELGIPFWSSRNKYAKEEDDEDEDTDDELPMNADLLLEVRSGKRKLVGMPEMTLLMDPYESLERLKSRDGIFFTKEVVFSNTVRTMVNINDEVGDNEKSKKVRSGRKVRLVEPKTITNYVCNAACEPIQWDVKTFEATTITQQSSE